MNYELVGRMELILYFGKQILFATNYVVSFTIFHICSGEYAYNSFSPDTHICNSFFYYSESKPTWLSMRYITKKQSVNVDSWTDRVNWPISRGAPCCSYCSQCWHNKVLGASVGLILPTKNRRSHIPFNKSRIKDHIANPLCIYSQPFKFRPLKKNEPASLKLPTYARREVWWRNSVGWNLKLPIPLVILK